jgi:hypothetical protein
LLFAQLLTIFRDFLRKSGRAVHSRRFVPPFGFAVFTGFVESAPREALIAFKVQFYPFAATLATPGVVISSHI